MGGIMGNFILGAILIGAIGGFIAENSDVGLGGIFALVAGGVTLIGVSTVVGALDTLLGCKGLPYQVDCDEVRIGLISALILGIFAMLGGIVLAKIWAHVRPKDE
jgi:hypothetical protein